MAVDIFTNAATTTVALSKTAPSALTQESWAVASSTGFPAASSSATKPTLFRIVDPAASTEVIAVTNVSGTTWTVIRGYEGTTPVTHATGFTVLNVVTAGYLSAVPPSTPWISVADFGAVADGSTDNTTVFQNALNAAAAGTVTLATSPSSTVYIPPGIWVTGPITIPHRVTLRGAGIGSTRLLCKAATANNSYMITNVSTATMISVSDMTLLGNLGNQANTVHGIKFNGTGSTSEYTDMRSQMKNLMVQDFSGDGVTGSGRGVCQVTDVQAWNNQGHGFTFGVDSYLTNCDAGQNGKDGFYLPSNTSLNNCKAWYSGYWNDGTTYGVQTANVTAGYGNGFHFDVSQSGAMSAGIYAQDNARVGIFIGAGSNRVSIAGWTSDSNNNGTGATTFSNVQIDASSLVSMTGGCSFDRNANTQHPAFALALSNSATSNIIQMTTNNFTATTKVSMSSNSWPNVVQVDGSSGSNNIAYGATVTPDLSKASLLNIGALTGNITIAAPSSSFNTGNHLTIVFNQDGTGGRTVTWNAAFNTTWQPTKIANSTSSISFTWDASTSLWQPISTSGGGRLAVTANNATVTTTTETVVLLLPIPANSVRVGTTFRYTMVAHPAASSIITCKVRIGTTGSTSDASVITMSATALTATNTRFYKGITSVNATGASATHIGAGTETNGAVTAAGVAAGATSSFNSTVLNFVSVTLQNTTSTTTTVFSGVLEILDP